MPGPAPIQQLDRGIQSVLRLRLRPAGDTTQGSRRAPPLRRRTTESAKHGMSSRRRFPELCLVPGASLPESRPSPSSARRFCRSGRPAEPPAHLPISVAPSIGRLGFSEVDELQPVVDGRSRRLISDSAQRSIHKALDYGIQPVIHKGRAEPRPLGRPGPAEGRPRRSPWSS